MLEVGKEEQIGGKEGEGKRALCQLQLGVVKIVVKDVVHDIHSMNSLDTQVSLASREAKRQAGKQTGRRPHYTQCCRTTLNNLARLHNKWYLLAALGWLLGPAPALLARKRCRVFAVDAAGMKG